jgi:hypothetical protein
MQDIRLVGNDGEYLNLETQSGDKFRLVLDESLRAAVKRDSSQRLDAINISPREIQDAVRAGASAQDVASQHSVPLDYVEKFALTVIDEIGHIIASAQAVRVAIAADRYSEATQLEFGEVVAERIANASGKNAVWSAIKFEGLPWHVTVTYDLGETQVAAVWSFDQRKLVLSPENEAAIKLSAGDHASSIPAPKLRTVDTDDVQTQVISLPKPAEAPAEPTIAVVPEVSRISAIEELTRASVATNKYSEGFAEEPSAIEPVQQLTETADLLEALRRKRAEANKSEPATIVEEPVVTQVVEPVAVEPAPAEPAPAEPAEVAPAPISTAKKGRPSMPSWDEIVFGTKTED